MKNRENFLQPGDLVELNIEGLGHSGEGIGRTGGIAVFVPGALTGEKIKTRIYQVKKNYARGELLEILREAPARIMPRCPASTGCGGCHLQHLDYQSQLDHKHRVVTSALNRIGGLGNVPVNPTQGMENPWHYRNKVHLQVKDHNDGLKLGFFAEGTHELVVEAGRCNCLLVNEKINEVILTLQRLMNSYKISAYHWDRKNGLLRHVIIRRATRSGQIMVVFVTSPEEWPDEKEFAREIAKKHPEVTSIIRNINDDPGRCVLGKDSRLLWGEENIIDLLQGLRFKISASSFYQVNSVQTETLYSKVIEMANLTGDETVIDAYCGIGTIALFLARHAGQVMGLEIVSEAVEDAKQNALLNNLSNTSFYSGPVETLLSRMVSRGLKADVVVLDPPRKGCAREVLDAVASMRVPRIIYVSCDPATLARDLGILSGMGYQTLEVQPVDMFPWTSHTESVVRIERLEG